MPNQYSSPASDPRASVVDLIRQISVNRSDTHMEDSLSEQKGPSFGVVLGTVVKVILALVLIVFVLFNIGYFLT